MIEESIKKAIAKQDLSRAEICDVMNTIMKGEATPVQIASILVALRMKGETVDEVAGAAEAMRQNATSIIVGEDTPVIDTCGTGGDGANTFNISTATSFVVAGAGIRVAKHGNRAISSKCGSADVLAALGVNLEAPAQAMESSIKENGIGFLFAPSMHPAMKHVMPVRRELGVRTIFNMLGPLANPVKVSGQVIGVFDPALTEVFANVLKELGCKRAIIAHGEGGFDEIVCHGKTKISELRNGAVETYEIDAMEVLGEDFNVEDLAGGEPEDNAKIIKDILNGELKGAPRAVVLINAAAGILVGEGADTLKEALEIAKHSIDSGAAAEKLTELIEASK